MNAAVGFAPLIPLWLLAGLGVLSFAMVGFAVWRRARGAVARAVALSMLLAVLANPRLVDEEREAQPDVVFAVVDRSASQDLGERGQRTNAALQALKERLAGEPDVELREVVGGGAPGPGETARDGTHLFEPLASALADVPAARVSSVVVLTDGQVHDVPSPEELGVDVPVHVLLSGSRKEIDRRLVVERAPSYGLVDQPATIEYRVLDQPGTAGPAQVTIRVNGQVVGQEQVPTGVTQTATVTLDRAGATVVELEADPIAGELTRVNNLSAVTVNAVRDRLRVLLISGQPHPGERMWRNLLKSDPAVDLVHFTILRPPDKDDLTPLRDLALIVFPIHELFEVKLQEFDLIIFDRQIMRDVLPPSYMRNIVQFVRDGGAVLTAIGPEFAGPRSLYNSPLGALMPGRPTGGLIEQAFRPSLTELGTKHPVTATLFAMQSERRPWGRWFRQIEVEAQSGVSLMEGLESRPLLVLDRLGEGRVAQLASDQLWLWGRDFEGGGPQSELLRRLAHWLMKEPELEEENLSASFDRGQITVTRRTLSDATMPITLTAPSGAIEKIDLTLGTPGLWTARVPAREMGLYRVDDGTLTTLVAAGVVNPREFSDPRTTEDALRPLTEAKNGSIHWLEDGGLPEVRRVREGRATAGRGWIGLPRTESFRVVGLDFVPVLPGILVLLAAVSALGFAWWREGR